MATEEISKTCVKNIEHLSIKYATALVSATGRDTAFNDDAWRVTKTLITATLGASVAYIVMRHRGTAARTTLDVEETIGRQLIPAIALMPAYVRDQFPSLAEHYPTLFDDPLDAGSMNPLYTPDNEGATAALENLAEYLAACVLPEIQANYDEGDY